MGKSRGGTSSRSAEKNLSMTATETDDLRKTQEAAKLQWTHHTPAYLDSTSFYGRLQQSMDELSAKDYASMGGLIAVSWAFAAVIIYLVMFARTEEVI